MRLPFFELLATSRTMKILKTKKDMIAAFLNKPKEIEIKNIEIPEPKAGEVRVKLKMIGVCGSDVSLFLE